jgi:diguanylate cyclase (GGDEF)-like protein
MSEVYKIGVVFRNQTPEILDEPLPAGSPWQIEFFPEDALLHAPAAPRRDFLVVFIPSAGSSGLRAHVPRVFPGSQVIGYVPSGATAESAGMHDGLMVVPIPLSLSRASQLLDGIASVRAGRRNESLPRGQGEDLQAFFDSFISIVESTWMSAERLPAMISLLGRILRRVRAEECLIYLREEGGAALHRAFGTNNIQDIELFEEQCNSAIVDRVMRSGTAYLDNDFRFEIRAPFGAQGCFIRSILCIPLVQRGQRMGVMEILNKAGGTFTEEDRSLMEMLSRPLSVAIHSIQMYDGAERLTITDDLTKLYNFRYLMQYLEAEVKRCLRYKKKASLLFIDMDGFKQVNDKYGHLIGSQVLAEMGQVLRKIVRETDVVGRYGGDEFVVVLPETPLNGALVIAERIRRKVDDYTFVAKDRSVHLTISLGVANCPKHTLTAEGLIKKADAAMYRAKELSKNSIKVAV